jgi:hypothetical protein
MPARGTSGEVIYEGNVVNVITSISDTTAWTAAHEAALHMHL